MKQIIAILLLLNVCSLYAQTKETITNKSVIDLSKAGFDSGLIISKIETSDCKFDLSTAGLIVLKKANVSPYVITAMMDKSTGKAIIPQTYQTSNKVSSGGEQKRVPQIDIANIPYNYDVTTNKVKELEKNTGTIKGKITAGDILSPFGGSSDIYLRIDLEKSPVRIQQKDTLFFLVNSDKGDPNSFTLYRMTSKKGKRETVYEKDNTSTKELLSKKKSRYKIGISYKKVRDDIYQFFPAEKLVAGEYCLVFDYSIVNYDGNQVDLYAFGID